MTGVMPRLLILGIAHIPTELLSRSWNTRAGFVAGTLPYMSPEQADGVRDDPRVDVYAAGAVVYRMLTGRAYLEFDQRETPGAQADNVYRLRNQLASPPSTHNRRVPAWLDAVVLKTLAKEPAARYSSAAGLREALLLRNLPPVSGDLGNLTVAETALLPRVTGAVRADKPAPQVAHRRLPTWLWLGLGGAFALLALVVVVTLWAASHGLPKATTGLSSTMYTPNATARIGSAMVSEKDGMISVYVPAGEFLMGSTAADEFASADEKPQHNVYMDAFWIDRTKVTNAMYAKCVQAGFCRTPLSTSTSRQNAYYGNSQYDNYPALNITWDYARKYCAWVGGRLPTEAEWEKAARGIDGRIYPWGNEISDGRRANFAGNVGTTPVDAYPAGASPYGALDMAGNAWEWVADWYGKTYYSSSPKENPTGPSSGTSRVLRGGAFYSSGGAIRAPDRSESDPNSEWDYRGFRCVRSP
jgi:eukaryotic-like serine/threonine-protein kinase